MKINKKTFLHLVPKRFRELWPEIQKHVREKGDTRSVWCFVRGSRTGMWFPTTQNMRNQTGARKLVLQDQDVLTGERLYEIQIPLYVLQKELTREKCNSVYCHIMTFAKGTLEEGYTKNVFSGREKMEENIAQYDPSVEPAKLEYIGITKQRPEVRFNQHLSSARRGSSGYFHACIREQGHDYFCTVIQDTGLTRKQAFDLEEKFVDEGSDGNGTLWPNGLNTIPGGLKGLAYLNKLPRQYRPKDEKDYLENKLHYEQMIFERKERSKETIRNQVLNNPNNFDQASLDRIEELSEMGYDNAKIAAIFDVRQQRIDNFLAGETYQFA